MRLISSVLICLVVVGSVLLIVLGFVLPCWYGIGKEDKIFRKNNERVMTLSARANTVDNVHVIDTFRSDLLGAFMQNILVALLAYTTDNTEVVLHINEKQVKNLSGFEKQASARKTAALYRLVGNETKAQHIENRRICIDLLFPHKFSHRHKKVNVTFHHSPDNMLLDHMTLEQRHALIEKHQPMLEQVCSRLSKYLPNDLRNKKYIAIHFRAGEVLVHSTHRFIHSSQYAQIANLLQTFELEVFVFVSENPPASVDSMSAFKQCTIRSGDSAIATIAAFVFAEVFVMAKSSFSYISSLLRDTRRKTYYIPFWHGKPHKNVIDLEFYD